VEILIAPTWIGLLVVGELLNLVLAISQCTTEAFFCTNILHHLGTVMANSLDLILTNEENMIDSLSCNPKQPICKKVCGPKNAIVKKDVKFKVPAKKWL